MRLWLNVDVTAAFAAMLARVRGTPVRTGRPPHRLPCEGPLPRTVPRLRAPKCLASGWANPNRNRLAACPFQIDFPHPRHKRLHL